MRVYRYEDSKESINNIKSPSIFLAGPTVRGNQPHLTSWRFSAINEFQRQKFDGDLIIPEFTSKTESDKGKEWIPLWEFNGLKKSDCILFWIPRTRDTVIDGKILTGSIALTTNMEFGYWHGRQPEKIIYGRPDDAYRIDYLDIMWKAVYDDQTLKTYKPFIYTTLKDTVNASIKKANKRFKNMGM